jgi:hypothetical protein
VVTLRRYFNVAEAALAKTLLDDHGIFCSIADENAYLYGGAGFAMSIRILVAEEQFEDASRVLDETAPALAEEVESAVAAKSVDEGGAVFREEPETRHGPDLLEKNNPWEILVVALLFFGPGVVLLRQKHSALMTRGRYVTVLSPENEHWCGAIAIAIAVALIGLYFYTRHAIHEERAAADQAKSQDRGLHPTPN